MRKSIIIALVLAAGWASPAWAMKFSAEKYYTLESHQVVTDEWYVAAEELDLQGMALQDVFAVASRVKAGGTLGRDLNILCAEAEIRGRLTQHLRIIAGDAQIHGPVYGNLFFAGRSLDVKNTASLHGDNACFAEEVTLAGRISGPLKIYAGRVSLNGVLDGDAVITADEIWIGPEAQVFGNIRYTCSKPAEIDPKAVVTGRMLWLKPAPQNQPSTWLGSTNGIWYSRLMLFIGFLAMGVIGMLLLPAPAFRMGWVIRFKPWASLGLGLLTLLVVPIVAVVLFFTLLGIPLAFLIMLFYLLALALGYLATGYLLGLLLLKPESKDRGRNILSLILGFSILTLLGWIPYVGGALSFMAAILGTGAMWLSKKFIEPSKAAQPEIPAVQPEIKAPLTVEIKRPSAAASAPMLLPKNWKPEKPAFQKQNNPAKKSKIASAGRRLKKSVKQRPARKIVKSKRKK